MRHLVALAMVAGILFAGCAKPGPTHLPGQTKTPVLASWAPGWQLNYTSGTSWENYTVLGHEDLNGTLAYLMQMEALPGESFTDRGDVSLTWLDPATLGIRQLEEIAFGARFRFDCPILRLRPLMDESYVCNVEGGRWGDGQVSVMQHVGETRPVTLPFGTFNETSFMADLQFPWGSSRIEGAYSADIGYMTRYTDEGDEWFVLYSMTMA